MYPTNNSFDKLVDESSLISEFIVSINLVKNSLGVAFDLTILLNYFI